MTVIQLNARKQFSLRHGPDGKREISRAGYHLLATGRIVRALLLANVCGRWTRLIVTGIMRSDVAAYPIHTLKESS